MELGISSLGDIIDFGLSNKWKNVNDLLSKSTEACLNFAEEQDIAVVEIVIDPQNIFINEIKQKFVDLMSSYSMKKQVHGPFIDVNLCSHNNSISQASVEAYIETSKLCEEVNDDMMTIHPGLANFMIESIREYNKIQLTKAIETLLDFTKNLNLTICLENMPKNTHIMLDENNIYEILRKINRTDLFLTYDTSHFYTNNGNVEDLWEKSHNIIKSVHLVDNFTKETDTHPPLGSGKVKFKEILEIINSYNYKGALIIELSSNKKLQESIDYINRFI